MFVWWGPIPLPHSLFMQLFWLIVGVFAVCFGQYLYMGAGLSCGPRDALLVAVGKRFPKLSNGIVNIALMSLALAAGWLMGGVTGLGTLLTMLCLGSCMDLVFFLLHFEPRSVHQQGLAETWAHFKAARTLQKEK